MSNLESFAEQWLAQPIHEASPVIRNSYGQALDWFRSNPHTAGFDQQGSKPDLDDDSPFGIARHFYWYFETHFFKAQKSLLLAALDTGKYHNAAWLNQPHLCVLDIGCGTGAATFALLDLLIAYHDFCFGKGSPVIDITVSIAAIDPCKFALDTYHHITQCLEPELDRRGIHLSVVIVEDEFPRPECIGKLLQNWQPIYPYTLLGISSNVIRPLQNQLDRLRSLLNAAGITQEFNLGKLIADAYDQIITKYGFKQIVIQDIATRNIIRKGFTLFDALKGIWYLIRQIFGSKPIYNWHSSEQEQTIAFRNSPTSYHGKFTQDHKVETVFLQEMHTGIMNENYLDPLWIKITSLSNLQLAWVRSRNYILHEDISDEVEIKLLDVSWEGYIQRLKLFLDAGDFSVLSHRNLIIYPFPKNEEEDRPKYSLRLNEQLVCTAISQAMPEAYRPTDEDHILGNRLNLDQNEFFYEPWFKHFKSYSKAINFAAQEKRVVVKTDLRSYYTNIRQNELYRVLSQYEAANNSPKTREILRLVLLRQLVNPPHGQNMGLPQSGITAGLWSSTLLRDVDKAILDKFGDRHDYYRYADDMAIIANGEEIDSILVDVQSELDSLGLILNPKKTFRFQASDYIERFRDDPRLGLLSKKVRRILESLYFLPAQYKNYYSTDKTGFLHTYASLLNGLHVHLSTDWLNRKIVSRGTLLHWIQHLMRGLNVEFPAFPNSHQTITEWHQEFEQLNDDWINSRDKAIIELVALFREALDQISRSNEIDEAAFNKARRALKFSAYRLAVFGISPVSDLLVTLLTEKPGLLSPKIMLKALVDDNCVAMVVDLAKNWKQRCVPLSKDGYTLNSAAFLCASACWALGFLEPRDDIQDFLYEVLEAEESTVPEKLMASEALIRIGYPDPERNQLVIKLLRDHQHICVEKNILLLLTMNNPHEMIEDDADSKRRVSSLLGFESMQQVISKNLNVFSVAEPSVIEDFYSRWYPDLPAELQKADNSSELIAIQVTSA